MRLPDPSSSVFIFTMPSLDLAIRTQKIDAGHFHPEAHEIRKKGLFVNSNAKVYVAVQTKVDDLRPILQTLIINMKSALLCKVTMSLS